MKILITMDLFTAPTNGVFTSVNNLREALLRKEHDVRMLTLSGSFHAYKDESVYYAWLFIGKLRRCACSKKNETGNCAFGRAMAGQGRRSIKKESAYPHDSVGGYAFAFFGLE